MHSQPRRLLGLAAAALVLVAGTAQAQGKGKGEGKSKGDDKKIHRSSGDVRIINRERDGRIIDRDERDGRVIDRNGRVMDRDRDGHIIVRDRDGRIIDRDRHDDRDGRRDGVRVPPGLAKKPGGMPPGQYKKRYGTPQGAGVLRDILVQRGYTVVRTEPYGESQYVYYRLRDGSVRRAIVTPGTDRLGFSNVPASLLREVLARLY